MEVEVGAGVGSFSAMSLIVHWSRAGKEIHGAAPNDEGSHGSVSIAGVGSQGHAVSSGSWTLSGKGRAGVGHLIPRAMSHCTSNAAIICCLQHKKVSHFLLTVTGIYV